MATTSSLMTIAEFERLSDPPNGRYELHNGELRHVPPPTLIHSLIEARIVRLLLAHLDSRYLIIPELGYRPLPEHEFAVADVAVVTPEQVERSQDSRWFQGAPLLIIEVLSPSNTAQEMNDKRRTAFAGGCQEFWEVDPKGRTVEVSRPDHTARCYSEGEMIRSDVMGTALIEVSAIYSSPA